MQTKIVKILCDICKDSNIRISGSTNEPLFDVKTLGNALQINNIGCIIETFDESYRSSLTYSRDNKLMAFEYINIEGLRRLIDIATSPITLLIRERIVEHESESRTSHASPVPRPRVYNNSYSPYPRARGCGEWQMCQFINQPSTYMYSPTYVSSPTHWPKNTQYTGTYSSANASDSSQLANQMAKLQLTIDNAITSMEAIDKKVSNGRIGDLEHWVKNNPPKHYESNRKYYRKYTAACRNSVDIDEFIDFLREFGFKRIDGNGKLYWF
jgi:hypothetical protein